MGTVTIRNVSGEARELDWLGVVKDDSVASFPGVVVTDPVLVHQYLDQPADVEPAPLAVDCFYIYVERLGHLLAFPRALWALVSGAGEE